MSLRHRRWGFVATLLITVGAGQVSQAGPPHTVDLLTDPDAVRIDGEQAGDRTGTRIATCDVDGDGVDDLVVGASRASGPGNGRFEAGEVYVVYGHPGAWNGPLSLPADADIHLFGQEATDNLGYGVACGDVDGDGFDDMVLAASGADSVGNTRNGAGQIHLVFGGPNLPSQIDLLTTPGTVLYGPEATALLGLNTPATGDVNGDGIQDMIAAAYRATHPTTGTTIVGRVHVLLGRSVWPAEIDLLTESDVRIFGSEFLDGLGENLASGDVDGDGFDEILAVAGGGDGPGNSRVGAGETHVFLGRAVWPATIDLVTESADMMIYGATEEDIAGLNANLVLGDLDDDGVREVIVGAWRGDGRNDDQDLVGEARTVEPGASLPPIVDLAADADSVVYGVDLEDHWCVFLRVGDVDGDGIDDLVCAADFADGPNETRPNAGEIAVVLGRNPFPADLDMAHGDQDILIQGALAADRLFAPALADINGDGVKEVIGSTASVPGPEIPAVWIIGPVDVDGDGWSSLPDNCSRVFNPGQEDDDGDQVGNLCDNCPNTPNRAQVDGDGDGFGDVCDACQGQPGASDDDPDGDGISSCVDNCAFVFNPSQEDGDGDGRGDECDACPAPTPNDDDGDTVCNDVDNCPDRFNLQQLDTDGDGVGDLCDSCPEAPDASQADADGDGVGDACDCQPNDPDDRQPGEVERLDVRKSATGVAELRWSWAPGAEVYSVTRGTLSTLAAGSYGDCLIEGVSANGVDDPELPPAGDGYFYLAQAQNYDCGLGSLGHDSSEQERTNLSAISCVGAPHSDAYPESETTVFGSVTGSFSETQASDDAWETIDEEESTGSPSTRVSRLEHRWTIQVPPGARIEFHVEGFHSGSADFDEFWFEYSTDGGAAFVAIEMPDLPLGDDDMDIVALLPDDLAGSVIIRVVDTNRDPGNVALDAVSVDEIFVRSIP